MERDLTKYLKFIELFTFEHRLWWPLREQPHSDTQCEIFWEKGKNRECWKVEQKQEAKFSGNREELLKYMEKEFPEMIEVFTTQLENSILTQSVFAQTVLDEAKLLLGDEAIEDASAQHHEFTKSLVDAVKEALGKAQDKNGKKSPLKLIHSNKAET